MGVPSHLMKVPARRHQLAAVLALAVGYSTGTAVARDLDKLVAFVVPAYTAMNFIVVCRSDDPALLTETQGPRGTALQYIEHIKNEAIDSLIHDGAVAVLTSAANRAREIARTELKKRSPGYPRAKPGELTDWCQGDVRQLVRALANEHGRRHQVFRKRCFQATSLKACAAG